MRNRIFLLIIAVVAVVLTFKFCTFKAQDSSTLENSTNLIQQQILNVGKLVVTEGHFSEVLTYKDQDKYFGGMISFDKKALVVVNAEVSVGFNLREVTYDINEKTKTLTITNIPEAEIKIFPDIKFYDVTQSKLNAFTGDDYNKISKQAKASIARKIEKSTLKSNAQNRLISELSKMLILTNSLGWTLIYKGNKIDKETDFNLKT
jgi:hypothetical protein